MFKMIAQLCQAITVLFSAFEKQANAVNHLSTWAEESAGAFADEARVQRQAKLNVLERDLAATTKASVATSAVITKAKTTSKAKPAVAKVA